MRINTNIAALNTYNQYSANNAATNKSIEKLSSGYRINSAADDAAGLAISEKMRSQIRGLDQASSNAQDGISLVQTAEGALEETEDILQRMRELTVQASSDTYTSEDKEAIQSEIDQLVDEIDRISSETEFNNKTLLDGRFKSTADVTTNNSNLISANVSSQEVESDSYNLEVSAVTTDVAINSNSTGLAAATDIDATTNAVAQGDYTLELSENDDGTFDVTLRDENGDKLEELSSQDLAAGATVTLGDIDFTYGAGVATEGTLDFSVQTDATFTLTDGNGDAVDQITVTDYQEDSIELGGIEFTFDSSLQADATNTITVDNNSMTLQIGANSGQTMNVSVGDMSAEALGVDEVDITTDEGAEAALDAIDEAIYAVSSERATLGAVQNRLEHTINNLTTSSENLTASESRIRDVDIAKEMMEYTTKNVLLQSSQSMLAQANSQPQSVLSLLQ